MPNEGAKEARAGDSNRSTAARIMRIPRIVKQRFNCHQLSCGLTRGIGAAFLYALT